MVEPVNVVDDVAVDMKKLRHIEEKYEQLGCIHRGAFGSIYLAQVRGNGRRRLVAIKAVRVMNQHRKRGYLREIQRLQSLNQADGQKQHSCAVICLYEHFALEQSTNAYLVTNYVAGGTLADWMERQEQRRRQQQQQPTTTTDNQGWCSERRLAWYILQLCEALEFIHERGIPSYDLNPHRILMDCNDGGKLVLADFGSCSATADSLVNDPLVVDESSKDAANTTAHYAAPELLAAMRSPNAASTTDHHHRCRLLDWSAIDSFAIGCLAFCLAFELLSGKSIAKMRGLQGRTLGDFLVQRGLLSDLEPNMHDDSSPYSIVLRRDVITKLLDPDPTTRAKCSQLPQALSHDPRSPLLTPVVAASYRARHRQHVTIDNIALGLFVQRGPDWPLGDESDGGEGSVGVITALDPDALYTKVTWSTGSCDAYRIGAKNKMEIVVGPPLLNDEPSGLVVTTEKYTVGSAYLPAPSDKVHPGAGGFLVAHLATCPGNGRDLVCVTPRLTRQFNNDYRFLPQIPCVALGVQNRAITPHDPEPAPSYWTQLPQYLSGTGNLCMVRDKEEFDWVVATSFGLLEKGYKIVKIHRVQSERLWAAYARRREEIALENWGCANERRLFHGTRSVSPKTIISDPVGFDLRFSEQGAFGRGSYFAVDPEYSDSYRHSPLNSNGTYQMFLVRVALGRVQHGSSDGSVRSSSNICRPDPGCHSVRGTSKRSEIFITYSTATQAYPEYLITYAAK
jgi:serine/threonine protein kinase